jgi:uncharacterized protein YqhQ
MSSRPLAGGEVQLSGLQATAPERTGSSNGVSDGAVEVQPIACAREGDGELTAKRDAPLGGQAVLEGVMMRGVRHWAVAVRRPLVDKAEEAKAPATGNETPLSEAFEVAMEREAALGAEEERGQLEPLGEIEVKTFPLTSALSRHRSLRIPVLRGIVALGGSLAIGFKALGISANAQLPADEAEQEPQEIGAGIWAGTIVVSLVFAIGLFFLLPLGLTSLIKDQLKSSALFWIVEGCVRTAIFLGYMVLLSRIKDLRRVFEYHGAEHKTISCFEAGLDLTPRNAQRFSRLHPRCGTSFLLIVMVVSIFVFGAVGMPAWYLLVATRIFGVPIIAGISFEIIKFAGRNRSRRWVRAVMWPGLKLQLLTTREPDLDQLAVAIAALQAVLALEEPGSLDAKDLVGVEVVA